jgi:hypothetical protein
MQLIGLDLSEGGGAIPREVDMIDTAVRWPEVVPSRQLWRLAASGLVIVRVFQLRLL